MKKCWQIFVIMGLLSSFWGCSSLSNNGLTGYFQSDSDLKMAVESAFYENRVLAGAPIGIRSEKGQVTLTGYVKTIRQSDVAEEVARKTPGVHAVENNLIVRK